jgi:thymidylate synthase ThyX
MKQTTRTDEVHRSVIIVDDLPPEANAMVQALYSRSPKSVIEHLEQVKRVGPEKFMKNFYVGYGHKSIGDCGTTSIFIENVSMLAAKAIQDWPLYNGQEASTRYLNFASQPIVSPMKEHSNLQKDWIDFYARVVDHVTESLFDKHPKGESVSKTVYQKAIKARAFDIARGFLPAGATTFVSWHTNLRQAHDHLEQLKYHPLDEVKQIAQEVRGQLSEKYPSSFAHKVREKQEDYLQSISNPYHVKNESMEFHFSSNLNLSSLAKENAHLIRPPHAELPQSYIHHGSITFELYLDYGSYRDLQRHRSAFISHPFLSVDNGFEQWYLDHLGSSKLLSEAQERLRAFESCFKVYNFDRPDAQYFIPMGYRVPIRMTCSLPSAVYIAELRSADTVHPTLRTVAQKMGDAIVSTVPGIAMYHDKSPDEWIERRGNHDIVEK